MLIDVIIPTLDEEVGIAACLAAVRALPGIGAVVVVDGGSGDRTAVIAGAVPGVRVLRAVRGRGTQMNAGAHATSAAVLLFLHADVRLPADVAARVTDALASPGVVAGAFRTRTVAAGAPAWLAPLLRLADLRSRVSRVPYGDQAVFVRRAAFERAGGFPDQPLMEDVELALRLRRLGRIARVPAVVTVSGRRFVARPVASLLAMRVFPWLYRWGVSPRALARWYGNPR
jgi:rSAM/selenodomain-associated transferase 2